jgi:cytochrome c551/c552
MKGYRLALIVAISCFTVSLSYQVPLRGQGPASAAPSRTAAAAKPAVAPAATAGEDPRPVLNKYCAGCHNSKMKIGGLALDAVDTAHAGENTDVWEKVVRKIRTGAMPPVGRPRPEKAAADGVVSYLETSLDRYALDHPNPGRPSLHRLNRTEYSNAVRDMLGLEIDAASLLPSDNAAYGFDNVADALSLSPALTERYLGAAAKIGQMALARVKETSLPETFFVPTDRNQGERVNDDLPFGSRGGLAFRYYFPVDGEYTFESRLKEDGAGGGVQGLTEEPHQLEARIDDTKVWEVTIGGPAPGGRGRGRGAGRGGAEPPAPGVAEPPARGAGPGPAGAGQAAAPGAGGREAAPAAPADPNLQYRRARVLPNLTFKVQAKAGEHLVAVYFVNKTTAFLEDLFDRSNRRDPYRAGNGEPVLSSVTVTAPGAANRPPLRSDSPSRRKLLICTPASAAQEAPCAKQVLSTIARLAYRRPVVAEDMEIPLKLYADAAAKGGFEAGIELALRSILVNPKFLFRFELQPGTVAANTPYRISDLDLASRLSFFLWSSIPDNELLTVATKNTLHTPVVLNQQIRRMLADARSEAIVSNFAGQWLHTRNVSMFHPSPELLFHFDDNLRQAFQTETEMFVASIIKENRSALDLLDADYTFLNQRIAKHYGIDGVFGENFRRVALPPDSVRRGLLGQGSILTDTSRANRTSPVIRGKWILENIFGAPPPPPPPNVPDLKDERDPRKILPMREQMAAHRANPVCAACHAQMDQLGFALENFDAIGEWRDEYGAGQPIDPSAQLPDGTKFKGPTELRKVLMSHSDEFLTTMTEKLLVYALGRGLNSTDAPTVRQIKREAAKTNYRFASLIQGIVSSTPFTMNMSVASTN